MQEQEQEKTRDLGSSIEYSMSYSSSTAWTLVEGKLHTSYLPGRGLVEGDIGNRYVTYGIPTR